MRKRQGKVIENAEGRSVFAPTIPDPAIQGTGDINWVCAHCDHLRVGRPGRWEVFPPAPLPHWSGRATVTSRSSHPMPARSRELPARETSSAIRSGLKGLRFKLTDYRGLGNG